MSSAVPPSLAPCATYFDRATELAGPYPFVSHQLRLFGIEIAMKMPHPDAGRFLMAQMDTLEVQKKDRKFTTPPSIRKAVIKAVDISDAVDAPAADEKKAAKPPVESSKDRPDDGKQPADKKTDTDESKKDAAASDASSDMDKALAQLSSEMAISDASKPPPTSNKPSTTSSSMEKELAKLSSDMGTTTTSAATTSTTTGYQIVAQTPQDALRSLAYDLYERARAADDPKAYPSASTHWGIVDAPKIARGLHAAAVILDCLKRFGPMPAEVLPIQTAAHRRSQRLGGQIDAAQHTGSPVPDHWAPVDVAAPFAGFVPKVAVAPAAPPPLFPSAGTGPVVKR